MHTEIVEKAALRASTYSGAHHGPTVFGMVRALSAVPGGDALLKHFIETRNDEEFDDYIAEAWFVAVFTSCGYEVQIYPEGSAGPDLLLRRNGESFYIEITRFRPVNDGPPPMPKDLSGHRLPEYGNPQRDQRKATNKIFHKFRQIRAIPSVVAIWNDDGAMEDVEVKAASADIGKNPHKPQSLEVIFYGSMWISKKQFHAFPVVDNQSLSTKHLIDSIESARLSTAVAEFVRGFV